MGNSKHSALQSIIQGCSRVLLVLGAAVFLIGGKFLYEIKHVTFWAAEAICIFGGVLLMLLGAGIAHRRVS
jgi:hypothetical protein